MDERLRFVARLLDGERMTTLCEEFGISRKTGYKIYDRYKAWGLKGLNDRSRRPLRHANQLPTTIERLIVQLKKRYPSWGAPKIREKLRPQCAPVRCPAVSTIHAVLDRNGLVRRRRRRPARRTGTPLSAASEPNALWCADFKGQFLLEDRRYCYPLTIAALTSDGVESNVARSLAGIAGASAEPLPTAMKLQRNFGAVLHLVEQTHPWVARSIALSACRAAAPWESRGRT